MEECTTLITVTEPSRFNMFTFFYIMLGFVYLGIVICGCIEYSHEEEASTIRFCEIILHGLAVCIYIGCGIKSWYSDKLQHTKDTTQTEKINCLIGKKTHSL
jgi:hypothetical protein